MKTITVINTKLVKGMRVYIKGCEAKKFLHNEELYIYSDELGIENGEKYRQVANNAPVVKWIKQKYIHIKRGN